MTGAEYLVDALIQRGVTTAFGLPGAIILPLVYAFSDSREISAHLTCHEQNAAFAALGYAQASGKPGVAYATRGPGICNMLTAIAEAYQESIPAVFITAHGQRHQQSEARFADNQELDIAALATPLTKAALNFDSMAEISSKLAAVLDAAVAGRPGPVLIDVAAKLWNEEVPSPATTPLSSSERQSVSVTEELVTRINGAKRPVLLIGDGLRTYAAKAELINHAQALNLPILSSRGAQDLLSGAANYYGYIGSHGLRYSNFILSKADLLVALGNRLALPFDSQSFAPLLERTQIIRVEIDSSELTRTLPHETSYVADARQVFSALTGIEPHRQWRQICDQLRTELDDEDCTEPVVKCCGFIRSQPEGTTYVCDVGNNEFWFARAYAKSGCQERLLISKSFGTLGQGLGKAIGAHYATGGRVVCVTGDQGLQCNLQELQFIAAHRLPVHILLLNNHCSGMIADRERALNKPLLHVTSQSGYSTPDFAALVRAFNLEGQFTMLHVPDSLTLTPSLPRGRPCQDLAPALARDRYQRLNAL